MRRARDHQSDRRGGESHPGCERRGTHCTARIFSNWRYATDKGLRVALATNGTLVTKDVARMVVDAGIRRVSISLDGADAVTHDAFRLRKQRFTDIWENSIVFQQLRDTGGLKGKCGCCEFRNVCMGCRARAFAATGDFMDEEPFCVNQPRTKHLRESTPETVRTR